MNRKSGKKRLRGGLNLTTEKSRNTRVASVREEVSRKTKSSGVTAQRGEEKPLKTTEKKKNFPPVPDGA